MRRELIAVAILLVLAVPVGAKTLEVTINATPTSAHITALRLLDTPPATPVVGQATQLTVSLTDASMRITNHVTESVSFGSIAETFRSPAIVLNRTSVLVDAQLPVASSDATLLVRSANGTLLDAVDLREAACSAHPLCPSCARAFPAWCASPNASAPRRSASASIDPSILIGGIACVVLLGLIVVLIIVGRHHLNAR